MERHSQGLWGCGLKGLSRRWAEGGGGGSDRGREAGIWCVTLKQKEDFISKQRMTESNNQGKNHSRCHWEWERKIYAGYYFQLGKIHHTKILQCYSKTQREKNSPAEVYFQWLTWLLGSEGLQLDRSQSTFYIKPGTEHILQGQAGSKSFNIFYFLFNLDG